MVIYIQTTEWSLPICERSGRLLHGERERGSRPFVMSSESLARPIIEKMSFKCVRLCGIEPDFTGLDRNSQRPSRRHVFVAAVRCTASVRSEEITLIVLAQEGGLASNSHRRRGPRQLPPRRDFVKNRRGTEREEGIDATFLFSL